MIKYENMSTLKIILNKYDILHKDIQNLVNGFDTIKLKKNKLDQIPKLISVSCIINSCS